MEFPPTVIFSSIAMVLRSGTVPQSHHYGHIAALVNHKSPKAHFAFVCSLAHVRCGINYMMICNVN